MPIRDDYRQKMEDLIASVDGLDRGFEDQVYQVAEPQTETKPTAESIEETSAIVVALEVQQNGMRELLPQLIDWRTSIAFYSGSGFAAVHADEGSDVDQQLASADIDLMVRLVDAQKELTRYIEQFTAAEQLLTQLLDHWRSALAVMEHDLKWQEYEAARYGDGQRSAGHGHARPVVDLGRLVLAHREAA